VKFRGQVAGHAGLAVEAAVKGMGAARGKGIAGLGGEALELADRVRKELDLARRLDAGQAVELAEERDPARRVLGDGLPGRALVLAEERPGDLKAPALLRHIGEPQLGKGDAHLRGPAVGVQGRLDLPDGIPVEVGIVVPVAVVHGHRVALDPGGVDAEAEGRAVVVEAVEADLDRVPVDVVTAGHAPLDPPRFGVGRLDGDEQAVVVIEDLEGGRLGRGLAFIRLPLDKAAFPGDLLPGGIVDAAVDLGRMGIDALGLIDLGRRRGRGESPEGQAQEGEYGKGRVLAQDEPRWGSEDGHVANIDSASKEKVVGPRGGGRAGRHVLTWSGDYQ
jgi:hypothetical protein